MNKKSIFRYKKIASEQVVGEGREWMAGAKEGWGRRQNEARGRGTRRTVLGKSWMGGDRAWKHADGGFRGCRGDELFVAKLFWI